MPSKLSHLVNSGLCTVAQTKDEDLTYSQEIRSQFGEQLRCLAERTDTQTAVVAELQDFYRRRAELEAEHSKNLEKLAKTIQTRNKGADKHKREAWQLHSMHQIWQDLLEDTKSEARQRASLADLYSNHVVVKLGNHTDDVQRIARKAMKTYQLCYAQANAVEAKFRVSEQQKLKYEESNPSKVGSSRRHRVLEKEFDKRQGKFQEFRLKALKARNEYLLCVDAANAALHKYFADDLSDLIDCMDLGMSNWLNRLLSTVVSARKAVSQSEMDSLAELSGIRDSIDSRADKQRFLEAQHATFMLPRRFEFRPHLNDTMRQLSAQKTVQDELIQRYVQIEKRLGDLKMESEEVWKTLETAEQKVLELQAQPVPPIEELFNFNMTSQPASDRRTCKETDTQIQKRKLDLADVEDFYLEKFQHYLLINNLMKRLQARSDLIRKALGGAVVAGAPAGSFPSAASTSEHRLSNNQSDTNGHSNANGVNFPSRPFDFVSNVRSNSIDSNSEYEAALMPGGNEMATTPLSESDGGGGGYGGLAHRPPTLPPKPRKRRIGATALEKRPKLFAGSLEEYVDATGEDIPLVVYSCVRMLSQFALHHQGVFRVSGSQLEISALKDAFEKGDDPLASVDDSNLVNPVAGVLKLYFRELREPLFPIYMFDQFTDAAKIANKLNFVAEARHLIASLPKPVILVMRYLFAFLNHLSEFSDENMMDPYNLAVCFGPTLIPIPDGKDQVFYHNHVNEFTKNLIIYYEDIFSWDLPGPVYEKFMMCSVDDVEDIDAAVVSSSNIAASSMVVSKHNDGAEQCRKGETFDGDDESTRSSTNLMASLTASLPNVDDDVSADEEPSLPFRPPVASVAPINSCSSAVRDPPSPAPVSSRPKDDSCSSADDSSKNNNAEMCYSRLEDYVSSTVIRRHPPPQSASPPSSCCQPVDRMSASAISPPSSPPPFPMAPIGGVWVKRESLSRAKEHSILTPKERIPYYNPRDIPPPDSTSLDNGDARTATQFRRQASLGNCHPLTYTVASSSPSSRATNRLSLQTSPPSVNNRNSVGGKPLSASDDDAGLSPTSLHEIQTELKAVLTSLEQFSMKSRTNSDPNSTATGVATTKAECYKPDLVRNLPAAKNGGMMKCATGVSPTGSSGGDDAVAGNGALDSMKTVIKKFSGDAVGPRGPAPVPPKKPTVLHPQQPRVSGVARQPPSRTSSSEGGNYEVIGKF